MRVMILTGKDCLGSNHLWITIDSMIISPVYIANFMLLYSNFMISIIVEAMNALSLLQFDSIFIYLNRNLVGETVSKERLIYC